MCTTYCCRVSFVQLHIDMCFCSCTNMFLTFNLKQQGWNVVIINHVPCSRRDSWLGVHRHSFTWKRGVCYRAVVWGMSWLGRQRFCSPVQCPVYLHIPWIGNISMKFEKQITSAVKRCFFSVEPHAVSTTRQLLPATKKDVLPSHNQNNVI